MNDYITDFALSLQSNIQIDTGGIFAKELGILLLTGRKINAIKKLRNATGLGLKEAKDFTEAYLPKLQSEGGYTYGMTTSAGLFQEHFAKLQQPASFQEVSNLRVTIKNLRDTIDGLYKEIDRHTDEKLDLKAENANLKAIIANPAKANPAEATKTDYCDCPDCRPDLNGKANLKGDVEVKVMEFSNPAEMIAFIEILASGQKPN